jgi:hypothetical protein
MGRVIACAALWVGCAQAISNDPINQPLTANNPRQIEAELRPDVETNYGDMVVAVETRFKLPPDQVEMLIAAGHDALRNNPTFRDFLKSMPGAELGPTPATAPKRSRSTPIATSDVKAHEASAE